MFSMFIITLGLKDIGLITLHAMLLLVTVELLQSYQLRAVVFQIS